MRTMYERGKVGICQWGPHCERKAEYRVRTFLTDGRIYDNIYCNYCITMDRMVREKSTRIGQDVIRFEETEFWLGQETLRALAFPPGSEPALAIEIGLEGAHREVYQHWEPCRSLEPHRHHCFFRYWNRCVCGRTSILARSPPKSITMSSIRILSWRAEGGGSGALKSR